MPNVAAVLLYRPIRREPADARQVEQSPTMPFERLAEENIGFCIGLDVAGKVSQVEEAVTVGQ